MIQFYIIQISVYIKFQIIFGLLIDLCVYLLGYARS